MQDTDGLFFSQLCFWLKRQKKLDTVTEALMMFATEHDRANEKQSTLSSKGFSTLNYYSKLGSPHFVSSQYSKLHPLIGGNKAVCI